MRMRLGLLLGFGAGYVLGAKAGHERYEEIRDGFNRLMGTEQAQQLQSQVRTAAEKASQVIEEKTADGVAKLSEKAGEGASKVSEMVGSGGSSSASGSTANDGIVLPPT